MLILTLTALILSIDPPTSHSIAYRIAGIVDDDSDVTVAAMMEKHKKP